jgi:2,5-diamino-6-(ribosylamino)-4(3H)-pyrimidinone 5'-phosphate reductase
MPRPYVICHMCTTIDGKIIGNRWPKLSTKQSGADSSAHLFETTAASFNIGAWLVGNTTMQEFQGHPMKLPKGKHRIGWDDFIAQPNAKTLGIGADAKGILRYQTGIVQGDHVVLLLTKRVTNDYLAHLQKAGVSYLVCGDREIDLNLALEKLHRHFKLEKLMLQGGGKFNGSMLHANLVDEISQVIVPVIDGGMGVPNFFDIPGPPKKAAAHLRRINHKTLPGGVQWIRYRVIH